MQRLVIEGGRLLQGTLRVSGAKNAVLKLMAAALLGQGRFTIKDVPDIKDVHTMIGVLKTLGASVELQDSTLVIQVDELSGQTPDQLVREMRASIQVMGPLLARLGWVKISLPGGCAIGHRPIDLHLSNLAKLGAEISEEHGVILAKAKRLVGTELHLDFPSVGATENLMMAATLAQGTTIIHNAAREPEIVDTQNFLNKMGASVQGAGSDTISITGVKELGSANYRVIPDRIEAGTFAMIGALVGKGLWIENVNSLHISSLLTKLREANVQFKADSNRLFVERSDDIRATNILTLPYPGFATDLQPQFLSMMTLAQGVSVIKETIYPSRFNQIEELRRMGADVMLDTNCAVVRGVKRLSGAQVTATDLRAGAGLVLAALVAEGKSEIYGIEHIDRGYERFTEKLSSIGANVSRETITD